ncbi:hypothetical protein Tdes44962_MAKER00467 [Teratosphaeria destructans]|uniref:F-box domain-containing protein n=1 Tax=Teratosphaeria destructans TaxID=418781 RepID=A0A9W7SPT6_9PEZI|nr:hypothetical protein Tdes44962_MAKER00467 [Teratosphaeria destructans]
MAIPQSLPDQPNMDACLSSSHDRSQHDEQVSLLSLPAEIRIQILEDVFDDNILNDAFKHRNIHGGIMLDDNYTIRRYLQPLPTCKQLYHDGILLATTRTHFVTHSLFIASNIPGRLSILHPKQIQAIRSFTFVADARHFRKLQDWGHCPFGVSQLKLDTLTVVLHRSSFWHYLFDFTSSLVHLLRGLQNVKRLIFVRNQARVKGSFKTWYNRLVGLILKTDHYNRYMNIPALLESVWWEWSFDDVAQSFCLEAKTARPWVGEQEYMAQIQPLMMALKESIETEEWNPDPRAHNGA